MTEAQITLKQHECAWVGNGLSLTRDVPFFYRNIAGLNPAHRIDIITASPDHLDWYFRIYDGNRMICKNRHFQSQEDALMAARLIRSEAEATTLHLRAIERWPGDHSFAIDGLTNSDVVISEVMPNAWWVFATEENFRWTWSGPWPSLDVAFNDSRSNAAKIN